MSRVLVIAAREGATEQQPISDSGLKVSAVAGMTYRIVDPANPAAIAAATVRKNGDDLVIDLAPGKDSVVIEDFYFVCQFDFRSCKLDLSTLGGAEQSISPENVGSDRQQDGSILVWKTGVTPIAETTTPSAAPSEQARQSGDAAVAAAPSDRAAESPAPVGSSESGGFGKWGLVAGGLLAVGVAAGGGGGGDGGAVGSDPGVDEGDPVGEDGDGNVGGDAGDGDGSGGDAGDGDGGDAGDGNGGDAGDGDGGDAGDGNGGDAGDGDGGDAGDGDGGDAGDGDGGDAGDGGNAGGGNAGGGAGGGGAQSNEATITAVVSNTSAPDADPALNIGPGTVGNGGNTNDSSLDISGRLASPQQSGSVIVLRDGTPIGNAQVNGVNWSFSDPNVPTGNHTYTAQVQNADGSFGPVSSAYSVNVDHSAPNVSLDAIAGDNIIAGAEGRSDVAVTGQTEAGARVRVSIGGASQEVQANGNGDFTFAFDPAELGAAGTYSLIAQAIDGFGNAGQANAEFALDASALAPVTQTVAITSVQDDRPGIVGEVQAGGVTNDRQPEMAGSLGEALQPGQTVNVFVDGSNVGNAAVAGTNWSFQLPGLDDGQYSVTVSVLDADGDVYASSNPIAFGVDGTDPDRPIFDVVEGNSVLDLDEVLDGIQLTGRGEVGATVTATWLGSEVSDTVGADGNWAMEFASLPDNVLYGANVISVVQTDEAGNQSVSRDRPIWLEVQNPGEVGVSTQASSTIVDDLLAGGLNNSV